MKTTTTNAAETTPARDRAIECLEEASHKSLRDADDGAIEYCAAETNTWYRVSAERVELLGTRLIAAEAAAEAGDEDAERIGDVYSLWCADPSSDDEEVAPEIEIGAVTEEYVDGERSDLAAYVAVAVTVDGKAHSVATMVGVRESNEGSYRAAGSGIRPFLATWYADASDWDSLGKRKLAETVERALHEARERLWREVEALRA